MRGEGTRRDGVVEFLSRLKFAGPAVFPGPKTQIAASSLGRME
jgi:hypothetical protein